MEKVYSRPRGLQERAMTFCPGCLHGVVSKLICEILEEMGIAEQSTIVLPIGCACLGSYHFELDTVVALHGRAPAMATGIKRCAPEKHVVVYQGDGDLAAIGLSEIMYAANRGENLSCVFVNNGIYGMTGGQMAPTTLPGQKATTAQTGRNPENHEGYPLHMCEILSQLRAPVYLERCSLDSPAHVRQAKKAMRKAMENQQAGKGFSLVELMSNCPTNWGLSPLDSIQWMRENSLKEFPLGVYRDTDSAGVQNGKEEG